MPLEEFPTLNALRRDLEQLRAREEVQKAMDRARQARADARSREPTTRLDAPWLGESYNLTRAQREVVRLLLAACVEVGEPDVPERTLLRKSRTDCETLAELFADHPAWGALIVPGIREGTYRMVGPEAA